MVRTPDSSRDILLLLRVIGAGTCTYEQLRYTLEYNATQDVVNHYVLNRLYCPDERAWVTALLTQYDVAYSILPFEQSVFDAISKPGEDRQPCTDANHLQQLFQAHLLYLTNVRGCRNWCLAYSQQQQQQCPWVAVLDSCSVFTHSTLRTLNQRLELLDGTVHYVTIPQERLDVPEESLSDWMNSSRLHAVSTQERQQVVVVFRRNAAQAIDFQDNDAQSREVRLQLVPECSSTSSTMDDLQVVRLDREPSSAEWLVSMLRVTARLCAAPTYAPGANTSGALRTPPTVYTALGKQSNAHFQALRAAYDSGTEYALMVEVAGAEQPLLDRWGELWRSVLTFWPGNMLVVTTQGMQQSPPLVPVQPGTSEQARLAYLVRRDAMRRLLLLQHPPHGIPEQVPPALLRDSSGTFHCTLGPHLDPDRPPLPGWQRSQNRYLLITSMGDQWEHEEQQWTRADGVDVVIVYTGDREKVYKQYVRRTPYTFRHKGSMYQNAKYVYSRVGPERLAQYEYILVLDESLLLTTTEAPVGTPDGAKALETFFRSCTQHTPRLAHISCSTRHPPHAHQISWWYPLTGTRSGNDDSGSCHPSHYVDMNNMAFRSDVFCAVIRNLPSHDETHSVGYTLALLFLIHRLDGVEPLHDILVMDHVQYVSPTRQHTDPLQRYPAFRSYAQTVPQFVYFISLCLQLRKQRHTEHTSLHTCNACGYRPEETSDVRTCARCSQVAYCSTKCQRADWIRDHKHHCTAPSSVHP